MSQVILESLSYSAPCPGCAEPAPWTAGRTHDRTVYTVDCPCPEPAVENALLVEPVPQGSKISATHSLPAHA